MFRAYEDPSTNLCDSDMVAAEEKRLAHKKDVEEQQQQQQQEQAKTNKAEASA